MRKTGFLKETKTKKTDKNHNCKNTAYYSLVHTISNVFLVIAGTQ